MDFAKIVQILQRKKARLTLAITDACNNIGNYKFEEEKVTAKAMNVRNPAKGYKTLFLKNKGYVTVTSSQPPVVREDGGILSK